MESVTGGPSLLGRGTRELPQRGASAAHRAALRPLSRRPPSGRALRPSRYASPLAGGQGTAPARCVPLRVLGRRHFGPRGASGKWSAGSHACPSAGHGLLPGLGGRGVRSGRRCGLTLRALQRAGRAEPLSTGPRHRGWGSLRQGGGDGGGAGADTPAESPLAMDSEYYSGDQSGGAGTWAPGRGSGWSAGWPGTRRRTAGREAAEAFPPGPARRGLRGGPERAAGPEVSPGGADSGGTAAEPRGRG